MQNLMCRNAKFESVKNAKSDGSSFKKNIKIIVKISLFSSSSKTIILINTK